MGRERHVDARANAMPPERFEVDLTSVCVRRGAVQLPFRLKDVFSEGRVAAVDADGGAAVELVFRPPRELAGLAGFFEAHALRANDAVALTFTGDGLRVEAVRRERSGSRPARGAGAAERTRTGPPATGSPGGAPRASESGSSRGARDDSAPRSAASPTPPSLRMDVPRASVPDVESAPPAAAPRRAPPRWEPLDVTLPGPAGEGAAEGGEPPADGAAGSVTVREVRRAPPPAEAAAPEAAGETAAPAPPTAPAGREPQQATPRPALAPAPPGPASGQGPQRPEGGGLRGLGRRLGLGRGPRGGERRAAGDRQARAEAQAWAGAPAVDVATIPDPATGTDAGALPRPGAVAAVEAPAWDPETAGRDIAAVRGYLERPDVPAIVRSERVAEALGVGVARVERALERVSEDSDQLSRIRSGAYMLRRPSQG